MRANAPEAAVLLAVSPLRRALQTVAGAFGDWLAERASAGVPGRVVVCPDIKERGKSDYACDRGRPASELLAEFGPVLPGLRLDGLTEDWCERRRDQRLTADALAARLVRFTQWVQQQPEGTVIVVGHQNVFWDMLEADFHNGEVRLYSIAEGSPGAAVPSRLPLTPPWQQVWPPPEPPRSALICATPCCGFLVHSQPELAGFCCIACYEGGGHGPRCERRPATQGAKKLNRWGEVSWTENERRQVLGDLRVLISGRGEGVAAATDLT